MKDAMEAGRPNSPPPMDFFERPRPVAGGAAMAIDLGGLEIELSGLDDAFSQALLRRYAPYSRPTAVGPAPLRVRFGLEPVDYFIQPPPRPEPNPILIACDGERIRYLGYRLAGWFDTVALRGQALLARGGYEPELRAMENYVRVAVAWIAAERGGALIHAASAVRHGRGYLFYGESGAGKSTLAANDRKGRVVSDDLSLVLPRDGGGLDLVGSPFRGTYEGGAPVEGRFPVAAGFRIVKAPAAAVTPVSRVRGLSELVGNLPFVAEAYAKRPDLFRKIEAAFEGIPLAHLRFRKDDSYWDAIELAGL
jgi:hypothetical protein